MTSLRKAELAETLTSWGLVVEGDESRAELAEAYGYFRDYRIANGLPWKERRNLHSVRAEVERSDRDTDVAI